MQNYCLIYSWKPKDVQYAMCTEADLHLIHRNFGHPKVRTTINLLKRASDNNVPTSTRKAKAAIEKYCETCRLNDTAPRCFNLTMGSDNLKFIHYLQVDTMFLRGKPVVHMIDQATHYTAAFFLRTQCSTDIWKEIRELWIQVYEGPPDYLLVDQGSIRLHIPRTEGKRRGHRNPNERGTHRLTWHHSCS